MNEKPQPITWQELKNFVNSIPEDHLPNIAHVIVEDGNVKPLLEPFFQSEDVYINIDDSEDCASLEDLIYTHGDDFNIDDYRLATKEGTPFLWAE